MQSFTYVCSILTIGICLSVHMNSHHCFSGYYLLVLRSPGNICVYGIGALRENTKFTLCPPYRSISTVINQIIYICNYAVVWFRHNCFLYFKHFWIHNDIIFKNRWGLCITISYHMRVWPCQWKAGHPRFSSINWRTLDIFLEKPAGLLALLGPSDRIILPPVYKTNLGFLRDPKAIKTSYLCHQKSPLHQVGTLYLPEQRPQFTFYLL